MAHSHTSTPLTASTPINSSSEDEEEVSPVSSTVSSGASSPAMSRAMSPAVGAKLMSPSQGVPRASLKAVERESSKSGLIPIHERFSSLIHKHEIPRKALHVSIGFLAIHLYRNGTHPSNLIPPLTTCLIPIVSADLLRFYSPSFNALYIRVLGSLMRESEVASWNGVIFYLAGTIAVLKFFPKDIATLSVVLLSWCDTAASTFGRLWGRYTPKIRPGKSFAGSFAAFVVGALSAGLFLGWVVPTTADRAGGVAWRGRLNIMGAEVTGGLAVGLMSVMTGLVASVSEVVDAWGLDDNVVIPVLSAVGVWGVLKIFG